MYTKDNIHSLRFKTGWGGNSTYRVAKVYDDMIDVYKDDTKNICNTGIKIEHVNNYIKNGNWIPLPSELELCELY